MGVLTDLIVADRNQAKALLDFRNLSKVEVTDVKGFDQVKGATLWLLLLGKETPLDFDETMSFVDRFESAADGGEEGPWIFLIPKELRDLIQEVDDARLPQILKAWMSTEEFMDYDEEIPRHYFDALYNASATAEMDDKDLLFRIAL